jgi:hypothetical protein
MAITSFGFEMSCIQLQHEKPKWFSCLETRQALFQEKVGGEVSAAWCTSGRGQTAAGLVLKTNLTKNQFLCSPRGELAAMNHSFSSSVMDPRTCKAEIP